MFPAPSFLLGLAYAGIGAGVGSVGAAYITARSNKGESRAHAAEMLTNGYGDFTDRLLKENQRLDKDNTRLRRAMIDLIEAEKAHQHKCSDHGSIEKAVAIAHEIVIETSQ